MSRRPLEIHDDRPHEHGGEEGWLEQLTFTFADPAIVGTVEATWNPIERRAEAELAIRLEDGVLVRASARENELRAREETVGGFVFACVEQMRVWRLTIDAQAILVSAKPDASMIGRSVPVSATLELAALADADGFGARRRIVTPQRFASIISSGAFAQPVSVGGDLRIGDRKLRIDAHGIRARRWGVREPDPSDARLYVAFDESNAVWFERGVLGDTDIELGGALGPVKVPSKLAVTRGEGDRPSRLVLGGLAADVVGDLPMDGRFNAQRLFVRCRSGDLEALGVAETAIVDNEMGMAPSEDSPSPARVPPDGGSPSAADPQRLPEARPKKAQPRKPASKARASESETSHADRAASTMPQPGSEPQAEPDLPAGTA